MALEVIKQWVTKQDKLNNVSRSQALATPLPTPNLGGNNPFLLNASNPFNTPSQQKVGVNQPLPKAMFLGYGEDDKPLYGGARLFILG